MPRSAYAWLACSTNCSPKASRKWATILWVENVYESGVREGTEPGNEGLDAAVNKQLMLSLFHHPP
jgi:hypothetical protein